MTEINIGQISEALNEKADLDLHNTDALRKSNTTHIIETFKDGDSWYRKYSDGWIEQGGVFICSVAWATFSFIKQMADTNYSITGNATLSTVDGNVGRHVSFKDLTTTGAKCWTADDDSFNSARFNWVVRGYAV